MPSDVHDLSRLIIDGDASDFTVSPASLKQPVGALVPPGEPSVLEFGQTFVPTGVSEAAKQGWYARIARRLAVRGECRALAIFKDGSAMLCAWRIRREDPTKLSYGYRKLTELTADVKDVDVRLQTVGVTVKGLGEKTAGSMNLIDAVE